jgi:hypothetical protein
LGWLFERRDTRCLCIACSPHSDLRSIRRMKRWPLHSLTGWPSTSCLARVMASSSFEQTNAHCDISSPCKYGTPALAPSMVIPVYPVLRIRASALAVLLRSGPQEDHPGSRMFSSGAATDGATEAMAGNHHGTSTSGKTGWETKSRFSRRRSISPKWSRDYRP